MTITQLLGAFLIIGALLTAGGMLDTLTVLDSIAVRIAGICLPLWELAEPVLRAFSLL